MESDGPGPASSDLISLVATVSTVRTHRKYAFVDLVPAGEDTVPDTLPRPLQVVLSESTGFTICRLGADFREAVEHFHDGAVVRVEGTLGQTKIGTPSVFAREAELIRVAPDPGKVLRLLVFAFHDGLDDKRGATEAASRALDLDLADLSKRLPSPLPAVVDILPGSTLWDCAVDLALHLAGASARSRAKRRAVAKRELEVLESVERQLAANGSLLVPKLVAYDDLDVHVGPESVVLSSDVPHDDVARRLEYERTKKAPQIAWFIRTVRDMVSALPPDKRCGDIVDVGGGRGGLACALLRALGTEFPSMSLLAVDTNSTSLEQGRRLASLLPSELVGRIRFVEVDASAAPFEFWSSVCLFVSLHACGGLADLVLSLARRTDRPYLICQCCFPKHASLNPRANDPALASVASLAECDTPEVQHRAAVCVSSARLGGEGSLWMFDRTWSPRNLVLRGGLPCEEG
ncbi:hypothetical protein DFJ74DRAFT_680826 [Hyaloraphidium curvatum]|nr:hypothetical protein DFJ74DRAFT_680826 [Hyaloraphidium curvatum]